MVDDESLWLRSVEALVRRGKSFTDSLEMADILVASRALRTRPGLAKCKAPRTKRAGSRGALERAATKLP
jgi:hypothetical protein